MIFFEINKIAIDKLYNSLSPYFEKEEYCHKIQKIIDSDEVSWEKSIVRRLFQVHERFLLVKHLRVEKDKLRMAESKLNEQEKYFVGYMYPSLCTYLLLTCFDQLGQPDDGFLTFPSWLDTKKKKNEREKIIELIKDLNKIDFTKKLYEEYNKIYSVKNSFYKFINLILDDEQKNNLLKQILIYEYDENGYIISEGHEDDKKKWLYEVRNNYTHNTYSTETSFHEGHNIDGKDWYIRKKSNKNGKITIVYVTLNFNIELENSVLRGIAEKIKKNSKNTEE